MTLLVLCSLSKICGSIFGHGVGVVIVMVIAADQVEGQLWRQVREKCSEAPELVEVHHLRVRLASPQHRNSSTLSSFTSPGIT